MYTLYSYCRRADGDVAEDCLVPTSNIEYILYSTVQCTCSISEVSHNSN